MSIGANQFDQIQIRLSTQGRKRCLNDPQKMYRMQEYTKDLTLALLQDVSSESMDEEAMMQAIDPYATITLSHYGRTPLQAPLFDILLSYGRSGEAFFERLLKKIDNPNLPHVNTKSRMTKGTTLPLWAAYRRCDQVDYLSSLIADSRVNIEAPSEFGTSLLNHCCRIVDAQMPLTADRLRYESNIRQLLARDAVLDPHCLSAIMALPDEWARLKAIVSPYDDQWSAQWHRLMAGEIPVQNVTQSQFNHFFSLGKVQEMIQSGLWDGHYDDLQRHISRLPDWVAKQHPMVEEWTLLFAKQAPELVLMPTRHWEDRLSAPPAKERT